MEDLFRLARIHHRRPAARARRLRQAVRRPRADLGARAAVPAAAGLRLGRDPGRRRARRHRPEVQPAARARHPARLRHARAGDPDDAAADRDRRRDARCRSRSATTSASPSRPDEIYGKTLSIPDEALDTWYRLLLGVEPPPELGPRDAKRALARALVARFHGADAAEAAEGEFDRVHIARQAPEDMPTVLWPADGPTCTCRRCSPARSASRRPRRAAASPRAGSSSTASRRQRGARRAGGRGRRQGPPARQAPVRARARGSQSARVWRSVSVALRPIGAVALGQEARDGPRRAAADGDARQRAHRRHHAGRRQRPPDRRRRSRRRDRCSPPGRPSPSPRWSTSPAESTTSRRCSTA